MHRWHQLVADELEELPIDPRLPSGIALVCEHRPPVDAVDRVQLTDRWRSAPSRPRRDGIARFFGVAPRSGTRAPAGRSGPSAPPSRPAPDDRSTRRRPACSSPVDDGRQNTSFSPTTLYV